MKKIILAIGLTLVLFVGSGLTATVQAASPLDRQPFYAENAGGGGHNLELVALASEDNLQGDMALMLAQESTSCSCEEKKCPNGDTISACAATCPQPKQASCECGQCNTVIGIVERHSVCVCREH